MKPICFVEEMKKNDLAAVNAGATSISLLEKAGKKIFENLPEKSTYIVVCGKGNNGGDGLVAAVNLQNSGKKVTVLCVEKPCTKESLTYYEKCKELGIICSECYKNIDFNQFDVLVDCLFGIGFMGEIKSPYKEIIDKINQSKSIIVSCDIASGLNGNNGLGNAVRCDKVIAIQSYKYGHFLSRGKDFHREYCLVDIGIPTEEHSYLCEKEDFLPFVAERDNYSYKGKYGYDAIFAGSKHFSGAAKLANLGCSAMRSGAGVIRLAVPEKCLDAVRPYLLETTLFSEKEVKEICLGISCIGIGCGWGREDERAELLKKIFDNSSCPLIIDADGLYAFKKMGFSVAQNRTVIITPHYAEMAYLCDKTVSEIENNPVFYAKTFARENKVIVALKGVSTIVSDGEKIYVTASGCAGMATAGSGDVLLGIMTAIVGQKWDNLLLSVAFATYLNGISGELAQKSMTDIGMTASDTAFFIPKAIQFLREKS